MPLNFADTVTSNLPSCSSNQSRHKTLTSYFDKEDVAKATIKWCFHTVLKHLSFRSAAESVPLFASMFPDSAIAKNFKLSKDKVAYTIVHGLAPYFLKKLQEILDNCQFIVISFDESLNKVVSKQQMDVAVRYWDREANQVKTRYFSSVFLHSSKAVDLKNGLIEAVGIQNLSKIIQVGMDGPNVNFSMLKMLKEELSDVNPRKSVLLDIGSCGLHNVHGAFKAGIKVLRWDVDVFLACLYYLFWQSPVRRGNYTANTNSNTFPLKFCSVRWVENESVARTAITMMPHLQKWVKIVLEEGKKNPLNDNHKNFKIVADFVRDPLAEAKLAFFISLATLVEPFLREFQSDDPLGPFLYQEITYLMTIVMKRFVKPEVLEKNSSAIKVELTHNNLIPASKIDLGFETKNALSNLKPKPSEDRITRFRDDCRNGYLALVKKLQERSPLLYTLTRAISCLDPDFISQHAKTAVTRLESCLSTLQSNLWISGSFADKVKLEYMDVCRLSNIVEAMKSYNRNEKPLDQFWMEVISYSKNPTEH